MENTSGIHPTERKVLIKPPRPKDKTDSGIFLPDMTKDREKYSQIVGVIVAVAPLAFDYASEAEWADAGGKKPAAGDRAMYAKNAGLWTKGKDGEEYLMMNDQDIIGTVDSDYPS